MKNYTTHIIQKAALIVALIVLAFLFKAHAQTDANNSENKIHIKIMKDVNGKHTAIDTTFSSEAEANLFMKSFNDEDNSDDEMDKEDIEDNFNFNWNDADANKLKSFSFNFHDDSLDENNNSFHLDFNMPNWSEDDRAKFETDMENLKKEMKKNLKTFDMHWDTASLGNSFNYDFKFKMPDEKEMEQLKEEINNFHFEMPDSKAFMMPPPTFNYNTEGLNDADKKQFDEQMKKAEEEYKKAMELLKEKNGNLKMPPPCNGSYFFNFNDDDTADKKVNKKVIIIQKSDLKSEKSNSSKQSKSKTKFEEGSSPNFMVKDFKYYPNPSNGKFELSFNLATHGDLNVSITNATGKKIYNEMLKNFSGQYNQSFDISEQGAGVYLLNIRQGNEWMNKKVVIK